MIEMEKVISTQLSLCQTTTTTTKSFALCIQITNKLWNRKTISNYVVLSIRFTDDADEQMLERQRNRFNPFK